MSSSQTAKSLDERLSILESIVTPEPIEPNVVMSKDDPKSSVIGGFQEGQSFLEQTKKEHREIGTFLNNCIYG